MENKLPVTQSASKTIFEAAISSICFMVEAKEKKKLEKIEIFFDFNEDYLQSYYKFENDSAKYSAEKQSMKNKDEKTLSDMLLAESLNAIEDLKKIEYANLVIDTKTKKITKVSVYYTNKIGIKRLFENPKK